MGIEQRQETRGQGKRKDRERKEGTKEKTGRKEEGKE